MAKIIYTYNFYNNDSLKLFVVVVVQSIAQSRPTLWNPMDCSTPGFPVLYYLLGLLKLISIESVMPINHLILCCPLLLLPSVFPSISGFLNELALCIRWPKYWSFSFSISFQWIFRVNSLWDWLVWPPHHPKDSQEFSLTPHFKSINSEARGGLRISLVPDFQNTILIITQAGNKIIQASLYFKHYTTSPLM